MQKDNQKGKVSSAQTTVSSIKNGVNNVVVNISRNNSKKLKLILLFWVAEKDNIPIPRYKDKAWFSESAQTRLQNIKKATWYDEKIHKIHSIPIYAVHEIGPIIKNWTEKYGGKEKVETLEIGVFSHCGLDGPITYLTKVTPPNNDVFPHQMAIKDGWDSIDYNWVKVGGRYVFYGCNSGTDANNGFAKRLATLDNCEGVAIWGQSTASYPSFYPTYRVSNVIRASEIQVPYAFDIGHTYMVGCDGGKGWDAMKFSSKLTGYFFLSDKDLEKNQYPKANPMRCFVKGNIAMTTHQGFFNDHRQPSIN